MTEQQKGELIRLVVAFVTGVLALFGIQVVVPGV